MKLTKIGDVVAAIPFGTQGQRKYQTVGALLRDNENDPMKGPGFVIAIEPWFNPAGVARASNSLFLSVYHPKVKEPGQGAKEFVPRGPKLAPFDGGEDDIPF